MIFFWRGAGIVVPVVTIGVLALVELLCRAVFDATYYQHHGWPKLLGLWIAAGLLLMIARRLKKTDEFFFVKVETWPAVLFVFGFVALVML